jgi:hypothetical protein
MALYFKFKPHLSFIAQCWWQLEGSRVDPLDWYGSQHLLKPIWVRFESGDGEDGYLRIESEEGSLEPWSPLKTKGAGSLHDKFWFGCYERNGYYYFQIRPIRGDIHGSPEVLPWYLDTDTVGYMGMYHSWFSVPEWVVYIGEDMWQLKGLDPHDLMEGERCVNLVFADNDDNLVTQRTQFGRPYLYTGSRNGKGLLSLQVLRRPYEPTKT